MSKSRDSVLDCTLFQNLIHFCLTPSLPRFLEARHSGHYKVYNLCSERGYDPQKFHGRVAVYPFDDHSPPEFSLMQPFCEDVSRWLEEDPDNVAAVHCKGGKGRTGLMICAYLLYSGLQANAEAVLKFYASKRTFDCNGVTQPSQRRYVSYFATKLERGLAYSPVRLVLRALRLRPPPHLGLNRREAHLQLQVHQTLAPHFDSEVFTVDLTREEIVLDLPQPLVINGDVKIAISQKFNMDPLKLGSRPTLTSHGPHAKLFHFWVNTCFLALGHSCPLTHTVADCRGRAGSLVTVPTTNRFAPLEVASPLLDPRNALNKEHGGLRVRLDKGQIEKAAKDGSGLFPGDFAVELVLAAAGEEARPWRERAR
jgi:hypothetical protein